MLSLFVVKVVPFKTVNFVLMHSFALVGKEKEKKSFVLLMLQQSSSGLFRNIGIISEVFSLYVVNRNASQ